MTDDERIQRFMKWKHLQQLLAPSAKKARTGKSKRGQTHVLVPIESVLELDQLVQTMIQKDIDL